MERSLKHARWFLPLALATAGAFSLMTGHNAEPVVIGMVVLGGATLGYLIYLLVHAFAVLVEHTKLPETPVDRRIRLLEADKQLLLRSIREIEFDAKLQKMGPKEAKELTEPLRRRAVEILRELDEAQVADSGSVDEQIDREVARRLRTLSRAD